MRDARDPDGAVGRVAHPAATTRRAKFAAGLFPIGLAAAFWAGVGLAVSPATADDPPSTSLDQVLSGVVHIKTFINPDGRTAENLGREREGSGIVIDSNGLVLTIGYLMVEAASAEIVTNDGRTLAADVVGYDNETGFGLLHALTPLKVRAVEMGKSSTVKRGDPMVVASYGGVTGALPVHIVAKREFAGNWEYMLDEALFTAPPHPSWSGAALINHDGKLVGVGSLIVGDTSGTGDGPRGNMFVPIDRLPPILGDLIADGRPSSAHPWLGLNTDELGGRLVVSRVTPGAPAEQAGLRRGDVILGVNGDEPKNLADFYRKIWAQGSAGADVPLDVLQNHQRRHVDVHSINRLDQLKLKSSF
jgi:S1-C subfamily serine protease